MSRLRVRLATIYPCCNGRAILYATRYVPIERYERQCPACGRAWHIERRTAPARDGLRVDVVEWEAAA